MEHLALEIFDLKTKDNPNPSGSRYVNLAEDTNITITDTSEIFASGNVWSHSLTLNIPANLHIFGTAGDIHGSRLHELINKRRARLWVEGLPLFLGYLKLDDEVEVDENGNVEVTLESGQKTFEEMIEGTKAREVSVGDVVIGVALNRKRVSRENIKDCIFTLDNLEAFSIKDIRLGTVYKTPMSSGAVTGKTPYVQRWPKLVKSYGKVYNESWAEITPDYTNIQTPYDADHPFCNINICYPLKSINDAGEEKSSRGYTMRLAHGDDTTDGGDNQTRYNNAPNFYLLHFINRLFKDLNISIKENEMENVEDLRRVFMLNYGCHYEEIEDNDSDSDSHLTPTLLKSRYGQYYIPIIRKDDKFSLVKGWNGAGQYTYEDAKGLDKAGKVLLKNVSIKSITSGETILEAGSVEGVVSELQKPENVDDLKNVLHLDITPEEQTYRGVGNNNERYMTYSAYLAYATGDNYPNVEISEIIDAMKSMFGVRLLFSDDYKQVRILLLRNIFKNQDVQTISCEIVDEDVKVENSIRGFRMTYCKGEDDSSYYYKGFADLFLRESTTWKDTTDKHDYSQWELNAEYAAIRNYVPTFDRTCYITPINGNAYGVKVDKDEDTLFPSLFEYAGYMDAEDGDCSGDEATIKEVQCIASPVIMNDVNGVYAVLFGGDLEAPSPIINKEEDWKKVKKWISTYAKMERSSDWFFFEDFTNNVVITGNLDIYVSEGFRIRLLDNYSVSNGGTPFDEADPGLCFGIMRSSGSNAHIDYKEDSIEGEDPMNDYWEVIPGDGAIDHPDTCDNYGNLWDYDIEAGRRYLAEYLTAAGWSVTAAADGMASCTYHFLLDGVDFLCTPIKYTRPGAHPDWNPVLTKAQLEAYVTNLWNEHGWNFGEYDSWKIVLSAKNASGNTAYADGRFSLKLRAEKPNPNFNPALEENNTTNRRYLEITNPNLRGRGLCDQFYKEYSYWIRNARIVKRTVRMELAQLLAIDKTKRVTVGDVTGFIRKMQYSVSNKTGLGPVTMEIMYI